MYPGLYLVVPEAKFVASSRTLILICSILSYLKLDLLYPGKYSVVAPVDELHVRLQQLGLRSQLGLSWKDVIFFSQKVKIKTLQFKIDEKLQIITRIFIRY